MANAGEDARNINGVLYKTMFSGDRLVVKKSQNLEPILDFNKAQRDEFRDYRGDMHKVASIPNLIVEKLMKEGIWQDKLRLKKWLNDPDNRAFRTSTGKV